MVSQIVDAVEVFGLVADGQVGVLAQLLHFDLTARGIASTAAAEASLDSAPRKPWSASRLCACRSSATDGGPRPGSFSRTGDGAT